MGQKVNPIGLRLGINRTWDSRWFAKKNYAKQLHEDLAIRSHVFKNLSSASISKVVVERAAKKVLVNVYSAKPGVLIGKKGADIDKLKKQISSIVNFDASVNIIEIKKPDLDSKLVADSIATQIEKRVSFRRAMKRGMQTALRQGALGVRINTAGRLGGAEIARVEWYREGQVPLHTLRSDVDYATSVAKTTYGAIGIKVWLYKGEIKEHDPMAQDKKTAEYVANK